MTSRAAACDWCMKPRAHTGVLKQCTGCAITHYCSKDCQTAAWPTHKHVCASRSGVDLPLVYQNLGYRTLVALGRAGRNWTLAHNTTLIMMVNALVELRGGIDTVVNASRGIVALIGPPSHTGDKSLSGAFSLEDMELGDYRGDLDSLDWVTSIAHPGVPIPAVQMMDTHPNFVGFVPMTSYFRDTALYHKTAIPLYRPQARAGDGTDKRTKTALRALWRLCSLAMSVGVVLHFQTVAGQTLPDIGSLVQEKKHWKWMAIDGPQSDAWAKLAEPLRLQESGLSLQDIFAIYHQLWP